MGKGKLLVWLENWFDKEYEKGDIDVSKNSPRERIYVFIIANIVIFVPTYMWEPMVAAGQFWFLATIFPAMICVGYIWRGIADRKWLDLVIGIFSVLFAIILYVFLTYYLPDIIF